MKQTGRRSAWLASLMVCGLVALSAAGAGKPKPHSGRETQRVQFIRSHYKKKEFRIPMRDGKKLHTVVYLPKDASAKKRYPILLRRTPYSAGPYGSHRTGGSLGPTGDYEREGFIFAIQDVRGTYLSEGDFVNMRPHVSVKAATDIDESTDAYDTIEWLLKELPCHNGKVGQWGCSYDGFYTSAGAIDTHPALKAISPQAPIADWFIGDDMHRNGALNLQMTYAFFGTFGRPRPELTASRPQEIFFGTPDGYQFFLNLGPLSNINAQYFHGGIPYWNEIIQHPNYDSYWQSRNILPHLKNVKAAVLTVGGWYDTEDLYGALHTYQALEKQNPGIQNTLVMGPWTHGGWFRTAGDRVGDSYFGSKTSLTYQPVELAFFKHYLKGGNKPDLPEAWMFETGANRWRRFSAWPPKDAASRALYFHANGKLGFSAPPENNTSFDEYLSDPAKPVPYTTEISPYWSSQYMGADQRFAGCRPDVLCYQTDPLEQEMTLAGPLCADLTVSTTGSDADFVVKLIDVNPPDFPLGPRKANQGGQQTLVRGEPFRARFREGFSTPKPLTPGQPTQVRFQINDVLHTFKRGHRIMVQIQSTWFPFIDRNPQRFVPNIFEAKPEDFIKATHRLYHNSALQVQVIPGLP